MKKLLKKKISTLVAITVIVTVILISSLTIVGAQVSFWDKVAKFAGETIGQNVVNEMKNINFAPSEEFLGAVASPVIVSPFLSINGVTDWYSKISMH